MKRLLAALALGTAAIAGSFVWVGQAEASGWQHVDQLGQAPVSLVTVNPGNRLEVAALAGDLWLSHDGGLTWRDQPFPAGLPAAVAYDPIHPGVMAVATYNTCLMVSRDGGLNWTQYRVPYNYYCNARAVIGTKDGFVFSVQQVIGYSTHLFRIDNTGQMTDLSSFPDGNPGAMGYDPEDNRLCVGTSKELYCSVDDGASWSRLAAANQVGNSPNNILIHDGEPWLVSDKGVMVYRQNEWLAPVYNDASKGSPINGLVINGENIIYGLNSDFSGDVVVFTANWPEPTYLHQHVYGLARSGDVLFAATGTGLYVTRDLVRGEAKIRRPVVVVPGITASLPGPKNLGALELDPITHTYDPLLARLRAVGYEDNKTLFQFPYNWRVPNEDTAELLKEAIAQAKAVCGCPKVDVVGHSMGGLVARAYIQGQDYTEDINKLIEVGTPNAGSVNSYYTWEGGDLYSNKSDIISRTVLNVESAVFHLEAASRGYVSFLQYIREQVTTVQELLPIFDYIDGRTYPLGYPRNSFLEQLDAPASVRLLKDRVRLRLIGGDTKDTLRRLTVDSVGDGDVWTDGRVLSKSFGPGDGTVLTSSLASLAPVDDYEDSEHRMLPTVAQNTIIRYLLEDEADQEFLNSIPDQLSKQQTVIDAEAAASTQNYQILYAMGEGKASVFTASGDKIGGGENNVINAYYSGDESGEHLFTIPSPSAQEFTIRFTAGGTEPQSIQIGGVTVTESSDEAPAGQGSIDLAPGDVVEAVYDASTQEVTIQRVASVSHSASGPTAPVQEAVDTPVEIPDGESSQRLASEQAVPESNQFPEVLGAASDSGGGLVMVPQPVIHAANAIVAPTMGGLALYGLEFWLAIVALIALMLALGLWLVLDSIKL